jgi:hypothetical protein
MFPRNGLRGFQVTALLLAWAATGLGATARADSPGTTQVPIEPAAPVDYWIVSTRDCPQSIGELCTPECFEYFHRYADGSCVQAGMAEFLAAVNPAAPVCFLVHGNLVSFDEAVDQGWQAVEALWAHRPPGMPVTFVSFTWPSDEVVPLVISADVQIKAARSDTTAFYLALLMNHLPASQKVSLLGYSHGARAVAGALELLEGGEVCGRRLACGSSPRRPIRASLIAAAMDHHWMRPGQRNGQAICQLEALQVFYNCSDWALAYYPLRCPFSRHALGLVGLTPQDWEALGSEAAKVQEVDAAPLVETMHHWSYYIQSPGMASLLAPYVYF